MPLLLCVGVLSIAALVQALAASLLPVGGGRPDLVLLLVACWALLRGAQQGGLAGLAGGILLDLFSLTPFGLSALVLGALGLIIGLGESNLSRGTLALIISTAVMATVAFHGASYLVLQALGWSLPTALVFARVVAPSAVLNGLLAPVAFRLTRQLVRAAGNWRRLEL